MSFHPARVGSVYSTYVPGATLADALPHLKELYINGRLWYDQPAPRVQATIALFSDAIAESLRDVARARLPKVRLESRSLLLGLDVGTMRRRVEETLDLLGIADLRARGLVREQRAMNRVVQRVKLFDREIVNSDQPHAVLH